MKRRFWKLLLLALCIIAISLFIIYTQVNDWAKNELVSVLKKELKTDSITVKTIRISFWKQEINVVRSYLKFNRYSNNEQKQFEVTLPSITVGIKEVPKILDGTLHIKAIKLEKPNFILKQVFYDTLLVDKISNNKKKLPFRIMIDELEVDKLFLSTIKDNKYKLKSSISLKVNNLILQQDSSSSFSYNKFDLQADSTEFIAEEKKKLFYTGYLRWDGKNFVAKDISYLPSVSKRQFYLDERKAKPYLKISAKLIKIFNTQFAPDSILKGLKAETLAIYGFQLDSYKNLRYPKHRKVRYLPLEYLKKIDLPIEIDTLSLSNASLIHKQNYKFKEKAAYIELKKIGAKVYGITLPLNSASELKMGFSMLFYGKFPFSGTLNLKNSKNQDFSIVGKLGKAPVSVFNPIIERSIAISLNRGNINSGKVKIKGNKYVMKGSLELDYKRLGFSILKRGTYTVDSSLWARGLPKLTPTVIRTTNTKEKRKYRTGEILYYRSAYDAFPKYIWRGVASGLFDIASRVGRKRKPLSNLPKQKKKRKKRRK